MTYLTDREINVIGVQRTGQHAITSWLIGHFDSVCYKNCMSQLGRRKGRSAGVESPFWLFEPKKKEGWTEVNQIPKDQDAIILGTEFTIFDVGLNPKIPKHKQLICDIHGVDEFSRRQDNILIIRDPYNQYASVLKWGKNKLLSDPKSFSTMWIKTAKECIGETKNFINKQTIIYDDWFLNSDYRRATERALVLKYNDDSRLNIVMKIGHGRSWGSSFDGMKSNKKAQDMDVLNRWESAKDDDRFIEFCKNEEVRRLSDMYKFKCPL